ncbi:MAG: C-type lectin domain-containing protein, partial [Myxococcales bacterium]|nr:C-type lectin domain-containing protein [Myxococcales bacterium]
PGGGIDAAVQAIDARVIPMADAAVPDATMRFDVGLADGGSPADQSVRDQAVDQAVPDLAPDMCPLETCNGVDDDCDGQVDEDAPCPCPRVAFQQTSLLFCADQRTWPDARVACQQAGYDLVVVQDAAQDAVIYGEMRSRGFGDTWIGVNDRQNEGQWVWLDGIPVAYQHWDSGEPNNGGGGEDCGLIMTSRNRETEWDDRPCGGQRPFVCGVPPAP